MDISIYPHNSRQQSLNLHLHKTGKEKLLKEFPNGHCILFEKEGRAYIREVDIDDKNPRKFTHGSFCFKESVAPSLKVGTLYLLEEVESGLFEIVQLN